MWLQVGLSYLRYVYDHLGNQEFTGNPGFVFGTYHLLAFIALPPGRCTNGLDDEIVGPQFAGGVHFFENLLVRVRLTFDVLVQQIPVDRELFELHQLVVHFVVVHFVGPIGPITVAALGGQRSNLDARAYLALAGVHDVLEPKVHIGYLEFNVVNDVGGHVGAILQPVIVG